MTIDTLLLSENVIHVALMPIIFTISLFSCLVFLERISHFCWTADTTDFGTSETSALNVKPAMDSLNSVLPKPVSDGLTRFTP